MNRPPGPGAPRRSHGIGLIEILIALVVLSIGFLAAARMQIEGMRFSQSAYYNSQAYYMATDIIDRMRANIDGVSEGAYDANFVTSAEQVDPGCATKACTPAEIASQDLFDWSVRLHPSLAGVDTPPALPSGEGSVARAEVVAAAGGQYTVSVYWAELVRSAASEQSLSLGFVSEARQ